MIRFPWWGSVLLAIVAYCSLKYGVVHVLSEEQHLTGLFQLFAPLAAMGFLLLAGKQLYDGEGEEQESGEQEEDTPPST